MDIKKWVPWNWFKKEEEDAEKTVPVKQDRAQRHGASLSRPLQHFHQEIDRLFEQVFRNFGSTSSELDRQRLPLFTGGMLKPTLDLGATDKDYTVTVEIPGVDEKDVKLEITNDTLVIRGEKKQEEEAQDKNYYRIERSYGSFQRVLSLPEDASQDDVKATFKKGVLTVTLPRKPLPKSETRRIEVTKE